ncbi:MAG: NAD(P)H-binding protein, partial [Lewinellaceae bacterium]|nr:NAD(P)H-binding protein [Lewinellaceae bacterium]
VPVRVLSRDAASAKALLGPQVEIVEGDVTSRETARRMLAGSSGVVVSLSAVNPRQIRQMKQIERDAVLMILEEMERAGISNLVYISVYEFSSARTKRTPSVNRLSLA